ncbi:MAG: hypothetical protein IPM34_00900 [Saprospiraceae bacterium]|nr:hypothetical protein [Saprospiraceae bacterium]
MPLIYLRHAIVKHYAGSVFELQEGFQNEEAHPILTEKMTARRYYNLPDDGKGSAMKLYLSDTVPCPEDFFVQCDLRSGPCRVTSLSIQNKGSNGPEAQNFFPPDFIKLSEFAGTEKQIIRIKSAPVAKSLRNFKLFDRKTGRLLEDGYLESEPVQFNLSPYLPGFYKLTAFSADNSVCTITVIKCYPLVVQEDLITHQISALKTVW